MVVVAKEFLFPSDEEIALSASISPKFKNPSPSEQIQSGSLWTESTTIIAAVRCDIPNTR